jgi:hypothetical protein
MTTRHRDSADRVEVPACSGPIEEGLPGEPPMSGAVRHKGHCGVWKSSSGPGMRSVISLDADGVLVERYEAREQFFDESMIARMRNVLMSRCCECRMRVIRVVPWILMLSAVSGSAL